MTTPQELLPASLYEQDFALWAEDTIAKLKTRKFEQIDVENLVGEIEALVRSNKRELENRLEVLLTHILKRTDIDSAHDNRGWMLTIQEQRRRIKRLLKDSPSLKTHLSACFAEIYQDALEIVRSEYRKVEFPDEWQFNQNVDAILNEIFWNE